MIGVKSVHGVWAQRRGWKVPETSDEIPTFRFEPGGLVFTPDAPRELMAHAFHLDLSCFWGLRGCYATTNYDSVLEKDWRTIQAAAASRLRSSDPCPDRILAGRAHTLAELRVELFEATGAGYRLVESIRASDAWPPSSPESWERRKAGQRVLAFSGAQFKSCQVVPATPSAVAAVRNAVPPPKLTEDALQGFQPASM